MIASFAAALLSLVNLAKDPLYADYPAVSGLPLEFAKQYDGTCIVRSLGNARANGSGLFTFSEEAVVLSSATIESGTRVILKAPSSRRPGTKTPHYRMTPGQNYLVIGFRERNDRLPLVQSPYSLGPDNELRVRGYEQSKATGEVEALSVFHTTQSELDLNSPPPDRLRQALFDCLEGESVDETIRLSAFMRPMNPIPVSNYGMDLYADTPLTKQVRRQADSYPPYQRAMLDQLLVDWHVKGSDKPFIDALMDCSDDPNAFVDPRAVLDADLDFTVIKAMHPGWDRYRPPASRLYECLIECQSAPLIHYYLRVDWIGQPTNHQLQEMIERLFDFTEEESQIDFCHVLAFQLDRPDMHPLIKLVNYQNQWVNKTQCLNFWSRVLKEDAIRKGTVGQISS